VTHLEPDACWALLRGTDVGRLAVVADGRPDIYPVNYAVDEGTLVFRTAPGTKLAAVVSVPSVAFEIDGHDEATGEAWSVLVRGTAEVVHGFTQLLDTADLPVFPWHGSKKNQFVRVVVDEMSGRRFRKVDPSFWDTQLSGRRPQTAE
jgi:nitroimidazol reductase NimA-like FMN-containing flavoprotein (pyridoxamine 5'-phosphate oxidase superfamily)